MITSDVCGRMIRSVTGFYNDKSQINEAVYELCGLASVQKWSGRKRRDKDCGGENIVGAIPAEMTVVRLRRTRRVGKHESPKSVHVPPNKTELLTGPWVWRNLCLSAMAIDFCISQVSIVSIALNDSFVSIKWSNSSVRNFKEARRLPYKKIYA